ncbi:MAG: RidA family protein [Armatimonadetes bacterium]|nr:RidA family protein [Armatimonadota bacterium]
MKSVVSTDQAPAAIGPYSQAIRTGDLLFVSGQIPIDPATGSIVDGGIEEQTHRVMQNLKAILGAAGASLNQVVKTTIYLTDLGDFATVNGIYADYFQQPFPARATVQVSALPKSVGVEIDAIAAL